MRWTTLLLAALVGLLLVLGVADLLRRPLDRRNVPALDPGCSIDLNSADVPTLALLPGIGPALAGRIVQSRQEQGPFHSADDLRRVKGFGPVHLEAIRAFVVCGPSSLAASRPTGDDEQQP
jgi:competence protein ComEA